MFLPDPVRVNELVRIGLMAEIWPQQVGVEGATMTGLPIDALVEPDDQRHYSKLEVLDPHFLASFNQRAVLAGLLDTALEHSTADMGNIQVFDPARRGLSIAVQRGFKRPFLDYFQWVGDEGSACAAASTTHAAVIVPDVTRSELFTEASREVMIDAKAAAVESIPLISSTGQLLGAFSCHYHKAVAPSARDSRLFATLAKAAVRSIQWQCRQTDDGTHYTCLTGRALLAALDQVHSNVADGRPCMADVHLHLGDLTFLAVDAAAAIVRIAWRLQPDRTVVLHEPPHGLSRILQSMFGVPANLRTCSLEHHR